MKDRTIKSKSPWMRLLSIGNPKPLDDLDKAHYETIDQLKQLRSSKRGIRKRTLK